MKRWSVLLSLALAAGCGQPVDRLTDAEALADVPDVPLAVPAEAARGPAAPAPRTSGKVLYRAIGTEPGWALLVREEGMFYQGRYGEVRIAEATPADLRDKPGTYRSGRLSITIASGPCSDGMSDKVWRDKVTVTAAGDTVRGCGGGEVRAASLEGTDWRVAAINGRPTEGGSRYGLTFANGRVSGWLGCNSFEGAFTVAGDRLATGQLVATEMACPDPQGAFEREGLAVLTGPMRIERQGARVRLIGAAGTIDLAG